MQVPTTIKGFVAYLQEHYPTMGSAQSIQFNPITAAYRDHLIDVLMGAPPNIPLLKGLLAKLKTSLIMPVVENEKHTIDYDPKTDRIFIQPYTQDATRVPMSVTKLMRRLNIIMINPVIKYIRLNQLKELSHNEIEETLRAQKPNTSDKWQQFYDEINQQEKTVDVLWVTGVVRQQPYKLSRPSKNNIFVAGHEGFQIDETFVPGLEMFVPSNAYCSTKVLEWLGLPPSLKLKYGIPMSQFYKTFKDVPQLVFMVKNFQHDVCHTVCINRSFGQDLRDVIWFCTQLIIDNGAYRHTHVDPNWSQWQQEICKAFEWFNQPGVVRMSKTKCLDVQRVFFKPIKPMAVKPVVAFDYETIPDENGSQRPIMMSAAIKLPTTESPVICVVRKDQPVFTLQSYQDIEYTLIGSNEITMTLLRFVVQTLKTNNYRECVMIAHNASKFDSFILLNQLSQDVTFPLAAKQIFNDNKMTQLQFQFHNTSFKVLDFCNYTQGSLRQLAKDYQVKHQKESVQMYPQTLEDYVKIKTEYTNYNVYDSLCLLECVLKYNEACQEICGLPFWARATAASLSIENVKNSIKYVDVCKDIVFQRYVKEAVQGGYSLPLARDVRSTDIREFDIVSLYPTAMKLFKYPDESSLRRCSPGEALERMMSTDCVILGTFTLDLRGFRSVIATREPDGSRLYSNGVVKVVTVNVMVQQELRLNPDSKVIDVEDCYIWDTLTDRYFGDIVQKVFDLKRQEGLRVKRDKCGKAKYNAIKGFLNHPFGKTIERFIEHQALVKPIKDSSWTYRTTNMNPINKHFVLEERKEITSVAKQMPPIIGVMILAYSKVILNRFNSVVLEEQKALGQWDPRMGNNVFLNIETDGGFFRASKECLAAIMSRSLEAITLQPEDRNVTLISSSSHLGGITLENPDKTITRLWCINPKFYFVQYSDGSVVQKIKGINKIRVSQGYMELDGVPIDKLIEQNDIVRVPQKVWSRSIKDGIKIRETSKELVTTWDKRILKDQLYFPRT